MHRILLGRSGLELGSLKSFAEVTSKCTSTSASDRSRAVSGLMLGGIGFSSAPYISRCLVPNFEV